MAERPRHVSLVGTSLDRRDLTHGPSIVEHMARDILAARRAGEHGFVDLSECGWTIAQAMRWGPAAHDLAVTPDFASHAAAGPLERVVTRLSGPNVTAALFGLVFWGSLFLSLAEPLG